MKAMIALLLCMVSVAMCLPRASPDAPPPRPYAPQPPVYNEPGAPYGAPQYEVKEVPKPYNFVYGVKDSYTGANYGHNEQADGKGAVQGSYSVALPDGRIQTVKYIADHEHGFNAEVTYEGEPTYPEHKPYQQAAPVKYAPAPTPPKYSPPRQEAAPEPPRYAPEPPVYEPQYEPQPQYTNDQPQYEVAPRELVKDDMMETMKEAEPVEEKDQ